MTEWFTTTKNNEDRLIHMGIDDKVTRRAIYENKMDMDGLLEKFEREVLKGKNLPKYKNVIFPYTNLRQRLRCKVGGFYADFKNKDFQLIMIMPENRFDKIEAPYDEKLLIASQLDSMYAYEGDRFTINI